MRLLPTIINLNPKNSDKVTKTHFTQIKVQAEFLQDNHKLKWHTYLLLRLGAPRNFSTLYSSIA
jgi:hypothetical protein